VCATKQLSKWDACRTRSRLRRGVATQTVEKEDVLRTWQFNFEAGDGKTQALFVKIVEQDKMKAESPGAATVTTVHNVKVKNHRSMVNVDYALNAGLIKVVYVLKPHGDEATERVKFEVNGESGKIDAKGKLMPEDKKKSEDE